jgi:hypothetical protein
MSLRGEIKYENIMSLLIQMGQDSQGRFVQQINVAGRVVVDLRRDRRMHIRHLSAEKLATSSFAEVGRLHVAERLFTSRYL